MSVRVALLRLPDHDPALPLPTYATTGAAGLDVCACLAPNDRADGLTLPPGARALVPTGLAVAVPAGFEMQVRPRSGLALRHGITLGNAPGTIDEDYRGEVGVILVNHGTEPFVVAHGMRVAQLVLAPVTRLVWDDVETLDTSARGTGGFGSTGTGSTGTGAGPGT